MPESVAVGVDEEGHLGSLQLHPGNHLAQVRGYRYLQSVNSAHVQPPSASTIVQHSFIMEKEFSFSWQNATVLWRNRSAILRQAMIRDLQL